MTGNSADYRNWRLHFLENRPGPAELPWDDGYRLTRQERTVVAHSVQQFQLGEWAHGRGLLRRASADQRVASEPDFLSAMEQFIAEEQRHSELLGRFLDLEGIPRVRSHWLDRVFRRLRKLAGFETCIVVLVTAEIMAIPFYQALRDATYSPLLQAICRRVLCDEAAHLRYQAQTLALLGRNAGRGYGQARRMTITILFRCTSLMVWQQHRRVFHAAGWDWRRFHQESCREFERFLEQIDFRSGADERVAVVEALRLED